MQFGFHFWSDDGDIKYKAQVHLILLILMSSQTRKLKISFTPVFKLLATLISIPHLHKKNRYYLQLLLIFHQTLFLSGDGDFHLTLRHVICQLFKIFIFPFFFSRPTKVSSLTFQYFYGNHASQNCFLSQIKTSLNN